MSGFGWGLVCIPILSPISTPDSGASGGGGGGGCGGRWWSPLVIVGGGRGGGRASRVGGRG